MKDEHHSSTTALALSLCHSDSDFNKFQQIYAEVKCLWQKETSF